MAFSNMKRRAVFIKSAGMCFYCGEYVDIDSGVIEHKAPKSKGGASDIENLVWSCAPCNSVKGPLSVEEFRKKIKRVLHNPGTCVSTALRITRQNIKREKVDFWGDGGNILHAGEHKHGK